MRSDAMNYGTGNITKTGEQATIASAQIHFSMEGRDILRVWDVNNLENEAKRGKQEDHYDDDRGEDDGRPDFECRIANHVGGRTLRGGSRSRSLGTSLQQ